MITKKIRILEVCPFSAGVCGVWARVLAEGREFVKLGYEVRVFSSDIEKGSQTIAKCEEDIESMSVRRFKSRSSIISKNVNLFDFDREFLEYKPDIVITHLLHPHSFKALKLCNESGIPCYLVTHAPFNVKRGFLLDVATSVYNQIKIKPLLNNFTKIIAVTKWEMPYLIELGVKKEKIIYIPNGLPEDFFRQKKTKHEKGKEVLFLGRIAPVKDVETLLMAAKVLPKLGFSIVGGYEKDYLDKIEKIISRDKIKNVKILPPVYDLKNKIELIDKHDLFILPSVREAMPQVLLEALARGKIVISSNTDGGKEIIKNGKNGLLFGIGDYKELAEMIKKNIGGNRLLQKNAEGDAKEYAWGKLIKSYTALFGQAR